VNPEILKKARTYCIGLFESTGRVGDAAATCPQFEGYGNPGLVI
jgi:hypothetical protein